MKAIVDEALAEAPSVERVVVWRRLGDEHVPMQPGRDLFWEEAVAASPGALGPLEVDSEHPYLLVYTSGTTGPPKGIVHVQGGLLVSFARESAYEADIGAEDVLCFMTDMGWIMGPWTVIGGHLHGCTVVYPEGAPDWPGPDRVWELVDRERISILGISPTLVRSLMQHGNEHVTRHDRSSLRVFVTTGEAWNEGPYRWLAGAVGEGRCPVINISGGTEIGAVLLSPSLEIPIKACTVGGPALGMAVDVVDEHGEPVREPDEVGELVCRKPFPGMTRGFWRDRDRYLDTYWRRFPGVWVHGDWVSVDSDGYWFMHGRSDDTLNIAGKRIGPAELESAAVAHPAVAEAAAVGVPHEVKGEVAWLVCVPVAGVEPGDELAGEVAERVGSDLGKAFVPDRVVFVRELPKTRSAKVVRRAVKAVVLGTDPGDLSSVENPEALETIAARAGRFRSS
jgi:acetyl-CoA synthetase